MAMIKRPFSRALYEAYDGKAKDRLAEYLQSVGHTIVSTKEDFNVDVVSQKGDYTYFNEAEVKTGWKRIKDTLLTEEGLKEAKGRYIAKGEKFFHIPYKDAELIDLQKESV